ncbi:CDP-glycerol glycerophosphotransferase family protein [Isobaculum melis]|uniref:CDP-glycerol glycerophosphotransferase, TagB/SpsB family n=1 Tax=Isobaculum melis TaxID=142588 RepID=A0A1H9QPF0_9LACT|nr:CDP-glycerol glycerophosphotransferase family protein [Isobaculum melis]SER62324.1 CDP-glycerol glycerophosphotransferase, TagB/SpsB family [Isobaculum melis]
MKLKLKQMINGIIAFILWPFSRSLKKKKILLVGGHEGQLFLDNGQAFYRYLTKEHPEYTTYFVLNQQSKDYGKVPHVITRGSIRNYLYFLCAEGVFYSHSCSDVAPIWHRYYKNQKTSKIFIEHGITGLKKSKLGNTSIATAPKADLWVSACEFDKQIKVNEWGLPADKVAVTGLPRYDALVPQKNYRKEIVYMPTWREWLADLDDAAFQQSDFYQDLKQLTENSELLTLLEETGYQLKIYIHFYFHKFLQNFTFKSELIQFLPVETNVQDYLINSAIMMTDYSSVAWDFFYMDKPVLFYQPDLDTYLTERGAYLDLKHDLFGPSAYSQLELTEQLRSIIFNKEHIIKKYLPLKESYFTYFDTNNCERVFQHFKMNKKDV